MSYCAPGQSADLRVNTCLSLPALKRIATAYNQQALQSGGRLSNQIDLSISDRATLWQQINQRLQNICQGRETCWLEQPWIKELDDPSITEAFRPKHPSKNRHQWLSTTDIHDVMVQYQKAYPHFVFLGPVPINFSALSDQLIDEVNRLDLNRLDAKIKQIGIIFNLSPWVNARVMSGSHWVALWIDRAQKIIAFYDSYGYPHTQRDPKLEHCIPPTIQKLVDRLINKHQSNYRIMCNTVRHQYQGSECGVYCMYFLLNCLEGHSVEELFRQSRRDADINRYRDLFFRPA